MRKPAQSEWAYWMEESCPSTTMVRSADVTEVRERIKSIAQRNLEAMEGVEDVCGGGGDNDDANVGNVGERGREEGRRARRPPMGLKRSGQAKTGHC